MMKRRVLFLVQALIVILSSLLMSGGCSTTPEIQPLESLVPQPEAEVEPAVIHISTIPVPAFATEPELRALKTAEEKVYKGQLISLHFQEANIVDLLHVIAEVSGLNLLVHPDVSGTVTVHLIDVPWDQALDIVLTMNNLSMEEIEGDILCVGFAKDFQEMEQKCQQMMIEARKIQEELPPLETRLININFASLETIFRIIEEYSSALAEQQRSDRSGTITVNCRQKTLSIQDTEANIEKLEEIVDLYFRLYFSPYMNLYPQMWGL